MMNPLTRLLWAWKALPIGTRRKRFADALWFATPSGSPSTATRPPPTPPCADARRALAARLRSPFSVLRFPFPGD